VIISIPAGVHWGDEGAAVTITVQHLKITRVRDNKSITINGTKTITNVSGGLLVNRTINVTHICLSITFDNGKQRVWSVSSNEYFMIMAL
jgi:hypothetical protein